MKTVADFLFLGCRITADGDCSHEIAAHRLSLVVTSRGVTLQLWCVSFSLRWLLSLWSIGSRHSGFSSCTGWAQSLWLKGLVAQGHVESSWNQGQNTWSSALIGGFLSTVPPGKSAQTFNSLYQWNIVILAKGNTAKIKILVKNNLKSFFYRNNRLARKVPAY